MAHTYNSYKASVLSSANPAELTTFNCPAGTSVLILCIGWNAVSARTGGSPTFNGVPMVDSGQGQVSQGGGETTVEVWYMLAPPTGTGYTISVPNTGVLSLWLSASCYSSATGVSAFDLSAVATGNSANGSVNITPTVDGAAIIAALTSGFRDVPIAAETALSTQDWSNQVFGDQYFMQASYGLKNMAWTIATETWEAIAIAFKEVVGGPQTFYQDTGQGATVSAGSMLRKTSSSNFGQHVMTIAGILTRKTSIPRMGGYGLDSAGILVLQRTSFAAVGQHNLSIAGTLLRKIVKLGLGSYSINISGNTIKKIFLPVGGYSLTIVGTLAAAKKFFKNVGDYVVTATGILSVKVTFRKTVGEYVMPIAGSIIRKIFKLGMGNHVIIITGILIKKTRKTVGGYIMNIVGTLTAILKFVQFTGGWVLSTTGSLITQFIEGGGGVIKKISNLVKNVVRNIVKNLVEEN